MAPPVETWPVHELPERILGTMQGRKRKDNVRLQDCQLLEMVQYECGVQEQGRSAQSRVVCRPIERLFRRCTDRNGTFMVETTAFDLEGGR